MATLQELSDRYDEHRRQAEMALQAMASAEGENVAYYAADGQIHATLALAAATMLRSEVAGLTADAYL